MEMSSVQRLRALVSERLNAAADDIVDLFCVKIQEYEEEVRRQRKQLSAFETRFQPRSQTAVKQEEMPTLSLRIKEEPEALTHQDLEATVVVDVPVMDGTEKPGSPAPLAPLAPLPPRSPAEGRRSAALQNAEEEAGGRVNPKPELCCSAEEETEDSSDYNEMVTDAVVPVPQSPAPTQTSCRSPPVKALPEETPFSCSVCSKKFPQKKHLIRHMVRHSKEKKILHQKRTKCAKPKSQVHAGPRSAQRHKGKAVEDEETEAMETGGAGQGPGGRETAGDKMSHATEQETDDSDDWEETKKLQMGSQKGASESPSTSDQVQTSAGRFSCSVCGRSYDQEVALNNHMKLHPEGGERFVCSSCHKVFPTAVQLARHKKSHGKKKSWCCPICRKTFQTPQLLETHKAVHTSKGLRA